MTLNLHLPEETPETFAQWGKRLGLSLSAVNIPDRAEQDSNWSDGMIHFSVTITRQDGVPLWRGNYSLGSAHPFIWAKERYKRKAGPIAHAIRNLKTVPGGEHSKSIYAEEQMKVIIQAFKTAAPLELGGILESLHCDISGVDQPFDDWADDLGMDSDSRRALRMYEACRETRAAFLSLPPADFEAFERCEES